jgi:hypothetical protein
MQFVKRHSTVLASSLALLLCVSALVTFALSSRGYPVQHVALHDGGIWVTNDKQGVFGRINKPAGALDGGFSPGGAQTSFSLDVAQDGAAVVARDRGQGRLLPVDVDHDKALVDAGVNLQDNDTVQLSGGTLAILRPALGAVWASRVNESDGVATLSAIDPATATPVAALPRGAGTATMAVAADGTIYVASTNGIVDTVHLSGAGFAKPMTSHLAHTLTKPQATAVGSRLVVLDDSGNGEVLGGPTFHVSGGAQELRLQAAGPTASSLILASSTQLYSVSLSSGNVTSLSKAGTGTPAAPVRLGSCVYAAWKGQPGAYARSCDDSTARTVSLSGQTSLVEPVFRINRASLVLNDVGTGNVWDVDTSRRVDDWTAIKPPPAPGNNDKSQDQDVGLQSVKKPDAEPDRLGARPGRATVLHVLDNDSDPAGNILSIVGVDHVSNPAAHLQIAPDAQTVVLTTPPGSGDVTFTYTVSNGKGPSADANVVVAARSSSENGPPVLRQGFTDGTWNVAAGGHLTIPVLQDWRDPDGDPVALVGSETNDSGSVTTDQDGRLQYTAATKGGRQTLTYQVSDGIAAPQSQKVPVTVSSSADTKTSPPIAQADVARGVVGQPVIIRPLDNDLPGSDPGTADAKLALATALPSPSGTTVTTDLRTGQVLFSAARPGTFLLDYRVAYGNAPFATGKIRVDIRASTDSNAPVAMPDVAVLHGQAPATVDVLANDFAPSGGVLAVQSASATGRAGQVQVAVVSGHWLRISALSGQLPEQGAEVDYTVTNGVDAPVVGQVAVRQLPAVGTDTPAPQDDYATVRASDSTSVPVLENDTDPGGDPITLAGKTADAAPGQLLVTGPDGTRGVNWGAAFVSGNRVRYIAPASVGTTENVLVDYVAQDPAGDQAIGHLHFTVTPLPSTANPDAAPEPAAVEQRVVAGDRVTIQIPTSGVDPDGDSVTVTGLGSAPTLGRIERVGMTSMTYLAYPTKAGTDSFSYVATDRYGKHGNGTIRIAVIPATAPQPPVAVDDSVVAARNTALSVDVLQNDIIATGDSVSIGSLAERNPGLPTGVHLAGPQGPIEVTAPNSLTSPLIVHYSVTDGLGSPSVGTLTVRSLAKYDIPPVALDVDANPKPRATAVTVDVLAHTSDADGPASELSVKQVYGPPQSSHSRSTVTVPVQASPQTIPFEIQDGDGGTSAAVLHVPAQGSGAPFATPGRSISIDKNGSKTIDIASYVTDPAGRQVRLTVTSNIWSSPAEGLAVRNNGDRKLVLTGRPNYGGPAAITFEVTDGRTLTDPSGLAAIITVPVQVGPPTPILRCPSGLGDPIPVVRGGASVSVDVATVCHVWTPTAEQSDRLGFSGRWTRNAGGLSIAGSGSRTLRVSAAGSAKTGSIGVLSVQAGGSEPAQLEFIVTSAPPPTMTPVTVDGIKQGESTTIDLRGYVTSPLRDAQIHVVGVNRVTGDPASATAQGTSVTLRPGQDAHGTITFQVIVSDTSGTADASRQVSGEIVLHVLGRPDQPTDVQPGRSVQSETATVTWTAPPSNGAPIDRYEVRDDAGTQPCSGSPCTINGLTNGHTYTFSVRAHNAVDWSDWSHISTESATPNELPSAIVGLTASNPQDGSIHLAWQPPAQVGSGITIYHVTWDGGGSLDTPSTSTDVPAGQGPPLDNDSPYVFNVAAENALGNGPSASVPGHSAGTPLTPLAPTFTASSSADSSSRTVNISWQPVDPNGPGQTTYTLTRTGGAGDKLVCVVTVTQCPDDGLPNDGTTYTYSLTAGNTAGPEHTSGSGPGVDMVATATPGPILNFTATATGVNGQAKLTFDAPPAYAKRSTITCTSGGGSNCGTWDYDPQGASGQSQTIEGLPNGTATTITLQDCNDSDGGAFAGDRCDAAFSASVTTFGPIGQPSINASVNDQSVNYTVNIDPNGRNAVVHIQSRTVDTTFETSQPQSPTYADLNIGYSQTDNISVTISDTERPTVSATASATTVAPPPPPPPPPSPAVVVSRGGGPFGKTGCSNPCYYIHVQTMNFSSSVTCTFNSSLGPAGFVSQTYGANDSRDSVNYFGRSGGWVQVTCGSAPPARYTWP